MSTYGNPDRPNKQEREASREIHELEKEVVRFYLLVGARLNVRVYPETYYSNEGFPSRVIEVYTGQNSSVRVCLQRNVGHVDQSSALPRRLSVPGSPWSLSATNFVSGRNVSEAEWDGRLPQLKSALAGFLGEGIKD